MDSQSQQQGTAAPRPLTPEGEQAIADLVSRHGVSPEAVKILLTSMIAGGGSQAQFNHPDLGGMGQWSRGGMLMVGDMFNNGLKSRVAALAQDLAVLVDRGSRLVARADAVLPFTAGRDQWPAELGRPSSTGSQNDIRYAVFPDTRRLAISVGDSITVYDTADHRVTGLGQQQGDNQNLTLSSQHGPIHLESLRIVSREAARVPEGGEMLNADDAEDRALPRNEGPPDRSPAKVSAPSAISLDEHGVILAKLEGLADLHEKGILSTEEYAAKKADLLGRL